MKNDDKKAVIYCRVSTKEQADEGHSLETQERLCREYAGKQEAMDQAEGNHIGKRDPGGNGSIGM